MATENDEEVVAPSEDVDASKNDGDNGGDAPVNTANNTTVSKKAESQTATTFAKRLDCGGASAIKRVLCPDPDTLIPDEIADDIPDTALFDEEEEDEDETLLDEPTDDSNLRNPDRRICVVTTAALPWRTGTAVNPLLRALYLTKGRSKGAVTLLIPWLDDRESRVKLYGEHNAFASMQEQEDWIRNFCKDRANCEGKVLFHSCTLDFDRMI